ncbi:response regulator [Planctomycetales bacterium ZRK34]|nr:response regulator [Planctomycetales bacterium ZRK34]
MKLKHTSFRSKLSRATITTIVVAILMTSIIHAGFDLYDRKSDMIENLSAQAEMLGVNSSAAILFNDPAAGRETLAALSVMPEVEYAQITLTNGDSFARYQHDDTPHEPHRAILQSNIATHWGDKYLVVSQPIIQDGQTLGYLSIVSNASGLYAELWHTVLVGLMIGVGAMIVAAGTANWLSRSLSRPLEQLTTAAQHISQNRDYSLRVTRFTNDEFGKLTDAFNLMIGVIEQRDSELLAARDELELRVEERTRDLTEAKTAAESANRAKSEFLANMSHEIRTPMTAILGYTDIILNESIDRYQQHTALDTIRRNGNHLLRIINDILDISKIEAGRMVVEHIDCDPRQVVEEVASLMMVRAQERGVEFHIDFATSIPKTISSDPTRLRQILVNLMSNAIKFTDRGSVRLTVKLGSINAKGNQTLLFEVVDTGIGISKEQLDSLFKPFSQADASMTRQYGGTGLGLTISNRFAEMLGGTIRVNSTQGVGSRFTLILDIGPLDKLCLIDPKQIDFDMVHKNEPQDANMSQLQGRILLAEDGPDNQRLIRFILQSAGLDVDLAENGRIAVDMALHADGTSEPYDIILMDMQMPIMDGYDATRLLRREGYDEPIIALTAHAMAGDREKCLDAGCNDYTTKPVNREELFEMIHRYLPSSPITPLSECALVSECATDIKMSELIATFVSGLGQRVKAIHETLENEDYESLARLAHQIKGAAGGYGYTPITEVARELEQQAKMADNLEAIKAKVDELKTLCHRAEIGIASANHSEESYL